MNTVEFSIVRDTLAPAANGREGYALGRISCDGINLGHTLEDEDRKIESGDGKIVGKTAMPLGRFKLSLYQSPMHGLVPLFHDVPNFSYTEIHRANHAEELKGCVAVGRMRTADGVADCQVVLSRIIDLMQAAEFDGEECWCTISRIGT